MKHFIKSVKVSGKLLLMIGIVTGFLLFFAGKKASDYTSTDEFCQKCHVHPHSEASWKLSTHYNNKKGIYVHCVDCHLPPKGFPYLREKAKTGIRDVYGVLYKDTDKINLEAKSQLEHAKKIVYKESCIECHQNLFPIGLTEKGDKAHLYYSQRPDELHCINCHLYVGHYNPNAKHEQSTEFAQVKEGSSEIYQAPGEVTKFENFTEYVPNTNVSFEMIAVPGGSFKMGSLEKEQLRNEDEGPVRDVTVDPFFMGKVEVSWKEYLAFFNATASEGRLTKKDEETKTKNVDAISGPTPPYGDPDQGWGKGDKPAITMTHHAAQVYCEWLSKRTGRKYRLPTEAEWEYACRAKSETPYFFPGNPKKFSETGFMKKVFGPDTAVISSYAIYKLNSGGKTNQPGNTKPNAFGLVNMSGNVKEFCLDYYSANAYTQTGKAVNNPAGPENGTEFVIRGGAFDSDASDLRCAARDFTQTEKWLKTDPQIPKSIWWYSDVINVGFRVVCEPDSSILKK
jgi:cytochrome c nitrite reductase small subunit